MTKRLIRHLLRLTCLCVLSLYTSLDLTATHNRAGEIIYEQIGPLTIRATIKTYTKASSTGADRDSLELFWGDGSSTVLQRSNGNGNGVEITGSDVKVNCYIGEHTYASRATYTLSFTDPNRVNGILNVNFPNSVDIPFYLETTFTLLNTQFQGLNNSVILLEPPLDFACRDKIFIHNPNAFDIDGDSIGYELVIPQMQVGIPVPNYAFPNEIIPGIDNQIFLDEITGDFIWNTPKAVGEYNIAIKISEFRNGQLISSITRDMQIFVDDCDDNPPIVESEEEICVIAGELLDIPIQIDDIDEGDQVRVTASGGPFLIDPPNAQLTGPADFMDVAFEMDLRWQTVCDHVREQYYQVVIRAEDRVGLVNVHTIRIKVIAPAPENLEVVHDLGDNELSWDNPYACNEDFSDNFLGFSVWRREGSNPFVLDTCEHGMEGRGYDRIEFITNDANNDRYNYVDSAVEEDKVFCYRITAVFARLNANQNPVNSVESQPSEEVCILAQRDIPFLTLNDVTQTDITNGSVDIRWLTPDGAIYDTILHPPPYRIEVIQSNPLVAAPLFSQTYDDYTSVPTMDSLSVENLDTENVQYNYTVDLIDGNGDSSISESASSIFLTTMATDMVANLSWNASTPWNNINYEIYRSEDGGAFELIDETTSRTYSDGNLINGITYCYFIKSEGTFSIEPFPDPIINNSQIACVEPVDNQPPCPVNLEIVGICDQLAEGVSIDEAFNHLEWSNDLLDCPENADIALYEIFFSDTPSGDFDLIDDVDAPGLSYDDFRSDLVGGCYFLIAIDSVGNQSMPSDTICLDRCSVYELPNAFTPNADGANDLFVPRNNLFVNEVDFRVFNKWGNLMFTTSDPQLNWDGKNQGGNDVDDGTYYYTCELFQANDLGVNESIDILSGFIEVLR